MKIFLLIIYSMFILGCAGNIATHEEVVQKTTKKQSFNYPSNWKSIKDNGDVNADWIKSFNDPKLEKLVQEALTNNKQIRGLQAQVERANALVKQSGAALKPTVGLGAQYSDRDALGFNEIYGAGLTASWEADVWGRLKTGLASAKENALATQSDYTFARQSLVAKTAQSWYMNTTSKLQALYAKNIVKLFEKELKIVTSKYEIGQVEKRNVYLAKTNLSLAKNAYSKAKVSYENAQRSLELLLGRYPTALIQGETSLRTLNQSIPVGIPSEIIERRPDLVAAEQRVAAAFYKQREAELLHLPRFTFSIGATINNLTQSIADLGAGLFAPLYTGGAIEAQVEEATAFQKQTIEQYAQKVLEAFKEVETALSLEEKLLEQESYLKSIVNDNKEALKLTKTAFEIGKVEYLDVSQLQNKLISSEISLLDISSKRIFNRINLHLALGGGFK